MTLLKYYDGASCMFAKYPINLQHRIGACLVESALKPATIGPDALI
jgi:hypothetical protein